MRADVMAAAVRDNISIAGVLKTLKRAIVGSNYRFVHREIARLRLDVSHWKGQAHGTTGGRPRLVAADVLVRNSRHSTAAAKRIVLRNTLREYKCAECGSGPVWQGKDLVLRLDHRNGIRNDHRLRNLRFLCPNCDSQTATFCGRNNRRLRA
jgi:predicted RNA-binding Zn-ribbon protein involved in translation (DUF1610 family)